MSTRGYDGPAIAHFRAYYLQLSETFIYHYLTHAQQVRNIVITEEIIPSAPLFPFDALYSVADFQARWTWPWFLAQLDRYLWRRDPLEGLLRRQRVALIHAHFGHNGCTILPWARSLEIPLVTSFYGFDASRQAFIDQWHDRYQQLFQYGQVFLVEGSCMRQRLVDLGCPPEKIHLQRIAIDVQGLVFRERTKPVDGLPRVLFCARFSEKKGLEYAVRAVAQVKKMGVPLTMRVVGDGDLRAEIEALISELNVADQVELVGCVPYAELVQELLAAHILIAPSVAAADGDSEGGAPTILLDAQATGLPILATRHADIPEVVLDGESGYLVAERDVDALAERLAFLVENPDLWSQMGRAGRKHMEAHHDVRVLVSQLEGLYFWLLEGK